MVTTEYFAPESLISCAHAAASYFSALNCGMKSSYTLVGPYVVRWCSQVSDPSNDWSRQYHSAGESMNWLNGPAGIPVFGPHAGTELGPQWMKTPNFASFHHCGC